MASASGYNYHRFARALLKKSRKWEPSLSIQLYPTYWRFENSEINFLYDGPMKPFLLALRAQVIPAALIPFLYDIRPPVSFVDGCLVVEIQDHRKVPEIRSRIVMRPAPETLPLTIDIMLERRHETWDEAMTLELESRIMAATSAPLYLGTSPLGMRNAALSLALTAPANPNMGSDGAPRSAQIQGEEEDSEQETIRKLLATGSGSQRTAFQPNWSVLRLMERIKAHNKQKEADAAARAAGAANASKPGEGEAKKKSKKKRPAEEEKKEEEAKAPPKKKKKTAAAKEKEAREKEEREKKEREEKEKEEKEKEKGKKKGKKKDQAKKDEEEKKDDKDKKETKKGKANKDKDKEKEKEKEKEEEDKADDKKKAAPKKKKKPAAPKEDK